MTAATILIIDDRVTNREYLMTLLGYGGHRLLQAADGAEGLAVARAEHPSLVIADILMPTMDGYEFVRQLRADQAIAATPVIFYTAHYHEQVARSLARDCGVAHVLTKPAEPEVVLRTVEAALAGIVPPSPPPSVSAEEFDRDHLRLLTDKLSQTANELRRANERLGALVDLSLELGSERDPRRILQSFCQMAREIVGARAAVVGVLDVDERHLRHCFTSGMDSATAARLGAPEPRQGPLGAILTEGRCIRLGNPAGAAIALGLPPSFPPCRAFLGAPLVSPTRAYGWLCLLDKLGGAEFSPEDERLARILAAQVGRIYENGSLYTDVLRHAAELEREVDERKRAEEALRTSEERTRMLLDSTAEAIYGIDLQGRCILANPACARLLGYAESGQLLGKVMHTLMHHTRADGTPYPIEECHIYQAFLRGEGTHVEDEVFWRVDGSRFPAEYWSYPIRRGAEIVGSVVTFMDITERKNLEDQLRQAQKMEAVGRLAGGIAHDFNNLLTVIKGYGDLVLGQLPADAPIRAMIQEIVAAGDRASGLTRQLLAFSRKAIVEPRVLDLKALVADVDKMLRRIIGEDIQLTVAADPEVGAVKVDPGQMEQVLLNLVVNARDAMPQGGRLTIEVRNAELDETSVREHPEARPGSYVLLVVRDTGCGMDRAILTRIFEPFFTTKGERGTGLGLATVYGIVKQSGGHIAVSSGVGHGTSFKVYLPRVEQQPTSGRSPQGQTALPHGRETVLLIEDEDGTRTLFRHVLQNCGYTVLEARDGIEAMRAAGQHRGPIDLVLTDVIMPRMGGPEVVERLGALRPGMKVLFVSGYTDDAVVLHGIREAEVAFLQKPFTPDALAQKVRAVLDG